MRMGVEENKSLGSSILPCFDEIDILNASFNLLDGLLSRGIVIPESLQLSMTGYNDNFELTFGSIMDQIIPERQAEYIDQVLQNASWLSPFIYNGGTNGFENTQTRTITKK